MSEIRAVAPDDALRERILAALFQQAEAVGLPFAPVPVAWEARDGGAWRGGLEGRITQGWLYVHLLAVAPEARGAGVGRALMAAAEADARARALTGIWLDTYSFQAPGFYARLGFEEVGRIPGYPGAHARIFLAKRLDGRPVGEGAP